MEYVSKAQRTHVYAAGTMVYPAPFQSCSTRTVKMEFLLVPRSLPWLRWRHGHLFRRCVLFLPCVWTLCILGYRIMSHSFFNHPVVKQGEEVETRRGEGEPLRGTTLMNARSQITPVVTARMTEVTFGAVRCSGDMANLPT
jgi:hypothetical protein